MSESPSADEVFQKIDAGSSAWQDIIPFEEHDRFVEGVKQAVQIYLSLVSPQDLRDELEALLLDREDREEAFWVPAHGEARRWN